MKKIIKNIIPILVILLIVVVVTLILNKKDNNPENFDYENYEFNHINLSEDQMEEKTFHEYDDMNAIDIESVDEYQCYYYNRKDLTDGGKYYTAKMLYPERIVTIEENVIDNGSLKDPDYFTIKSVLYSEQDIRKEDVIVFLDIVHPNSCGHEIKDYKKIKDNHYYIKYYMAEDC